MKPLSPLTRLLLATALLGSLAGCAVVPAQPVAYRGAPVYGDPYPAYRYGYPNSYPYGYYEYDRRYYGDRPYYGDGRRYEERRIEIESPLESAARVHRDVRRSLGLPRLPGMP
jgi:hypothetical protein